MPASSLKTLNLGQQTTFGTAVTPTQKYMGLTDATISVINNSLVPPVLGNLGPGPLTAHAQQAAEGTISATATFEMLRYLLNGIFAATTAGTSSGGGIFTYSYTGPTTSTQAHKIYTVEYGTTGAPYKVTGAVFSKLTVRGEAGGLWENSVDYVGKQVSTSTGPESLSDTQATPIRMADTILYVDASTGTMGATSVSATLIDFEWTYETGRHTKQFAGSITPGDYGEGKHNATLRTTLEFNASAKAYVDALIAATPAIVQRQIRIESDQGSSASQKTARLDLAGTLVDAIPLFADRDGNMTVELNWAGYYSTAYTNFVGAYIRAASSQTP